MGTAQQGLDSSGLEEMLGLGIRGGRGQVGRGNKERAWDSLGKREGPPDPQSPRVRKHLELPPYSL